jgi:hypothetical protein
VVEHSLGKGEVVSSILTGSTIASPTPVSTPDDLSEKAGRGPIHAVIFNHVRRGDKGKFGAEEISGRKLFLIKQYDMGECS